MFADDQKHTCTSSSYFGVARPMIIYVVFCHTKSALLFPSSYCKQFWKSVQVIEQKHENNYNRLHFLIYLLVAFMLLFIL